MISKTSEVCNFLKKWLKSKKTRYHNLPLIHGAILVLVSILEVIQKDRKTFLF